MFQAVVASWPLFLGVALLMLGNGLQGTLLGVRADLEGFSTPVTGVVMSAFYGGLLIGSFQAPRLIGRVGHVRVFAAFAAIASATVLLHAVFVQPAVWALVRALTGFSFAGLYIVAESWLNTQSRNEHRAKVLSVYMIVSFGGASLGQILLNVADPGDFVLFTLVSVLVSLAVVPMLLSSGPAPGIAPVGRPDFKKLYATSPLGVVGAFVSGIGAGTVLGMGAVFATQAGLAVNDVANFMFAALVAAVAGQFPLGFLADRFDRRLVMIAAAATTGALGILAGLAGGWPGLVLLVAAMAFAFPLYSVSVAHTNDYLDGHSMVAAAGGLMMINGIGAAFGPFAVGVAMAALGPAGFGLFLGAAHLGLAVFGLYRTFRRASVPLEDQGPTVMIPRATPVATVLAQEAALEQIAAEAALLADEMPAETPSEPSRPALV